MSRVAKKPVALPKGVDLQISDESINVKGPKGTLSMARPAGVDVAIEDGHATMNPKGSDDVAMAGTLRALLANMVTGVTDGFERKLELVGVGYRASMQGKDLNLSLGFSHPVVFNAPDGISIETRARPKCWSRVPTSSRLARLRPRSAASVRPSPTRARVSATPVSASS